MTLFQTDILDTGENYPSILSVAKSNAVRIEGAVAYKAFIIITKD